MALDEVIITEAIASEYFRKFKESLSLDVAIVGGGPSGMTAARKLAKAGAHGLAVSSAICSAESPKLAAEELLALHESRRPG